MIDIGVKNHDIRYISIWGIVVVVLNIVGIVSAVICAKLTSRVCSGVSYDIRKDMYAHINTLSHAELDKFGTATLNNRLTHDVNRIESALGMFLRTVMRTPFLIIGSTIMAMIIDIKLSMLFLVVAPLILIAVFVILKKTEPLYDRTQKDLDRVSEITRENLQGARVIRAFNKQEYEERRFERASLKLKKSAVKVVSVSTLLNPITSTIINFAIIAVMWFGGLQVNIGGLTQGQIIAFVNYLTQISTALVSFANLIIAFIKAFNCAGRINEVFDTKTSVVETNHDFLDIQENPAVPKIEFQNVSFKYSDSASYAFKNLSFTAFPGQTIGIIGGTGIGKSSIIYLVPIFYDAVEGQVYVDGINVKDLREKYDYKVQAGGKNFSGGQRQRLTIARAIVGNPEILILDDSASALDFATDANLRKSIKENINSTVILVSQRANTVKNSDIIIVLDNGRVVGQGKHDELLKTCDVYKEIYMSQTK